jgi:hypothetical protein
VYSLDRRSAVFFQDAGIVERALRHVQANFEHSKVRMSMRKSGQYFFFDTQVFLDQ